MKIKAIDLYFITFSTIFQLDFENVPTVLNPGPDYDILYP